MFHFEGAAQREKNKGRWVCVDSARCSWGDSLPDDDRNESGDADDHPSVFQIIDGVFDLVTLHRGRDLGIEGGALGDADSAGDCVGVLGVDNFAKGISL